MKKKTFTALACASTVLFIGFVCLYAYLWAVDFNPIQIDASGVHCSSITVRHAIPLITTNYPSKKVGANDPDSIYFTVANNDVEDMRGCYLYFFNQGVPYEYNVVFAPFVPSGLTNETHLNFFGYHFGSAQHIGKMLGTTDGDRERDTYMEGNGIYYTHMFHIVDKKWDWWTLMISLWYPIIIFSILPAIFVVTKLRCKKLASKQ